MNKTKYIFGENYILLNYKIENKSEKSHQPKYDIPKINIDPKLRLAALNSISDGSSYFKNRLNDIEKSIDSNRINIDSIENDQLIHLKNYLDANLDSELQSSDKDSSYLLNIFNLFYNQQWNILLDKLLSYIFKYCIETGIDINTLRPNLSSLSLSSS